MPTAVANFPLAVVRMEPRVLLKLLREVGAVSRGILHGWLWRWSITRCGRSVRLLARARLRGWRDEGLYTFAGLAGVFEAMLLQRGELGRLAWGIQQDTEQFLNTCIGCD